VGSFTVGKWLCLMAAVGLSLTGCVTAQERIEAQERRDDAQCSYAPNGSQNYYDCRRTVVLVREMNARDAADYNAGAAMQNAGAWLQARDANVPAPQLMTPAAPMRPPVICRNLGNTVMCQ
jgi:hypothetical protein